MAGEPVTVELLLLGPLEVRVAEQAVAVVRPKQRTLLVVLALTPGVCVSRDRLIDELWGESPPESAQHALQVHVSGLRKLLGAELVGTCPGGYKLAVPAAAVDAHRAAELLEQGRRDRDLAALGAAAALFRGEPLADVELLGPAAHERQRLEGLRAEVQQERLELQIAAGGGAELVAPLERLVAEQPLRERPRALLMLALYRAGRPADALAAFQDARRTFVDELGIEPSSALRDLERSILQQEDSLLAAPVAVAAADVHSKRWTRKRILVLVPLAAALVAAGVLAAIFLPPSNPRAALRLTTQRTRAPSTVVVVARKKNATPKPRPKPKPRLHHHVVVRAPRPTTVEVLVPVTTAAATTAPTVTHRYVSPPVPRPTTTYPVATYTSPPPTTTAPSGPTQISETFDGPIDGSRWNVLLNGTGANAVVRNGKLVLTLAPGGQPGGQYNFVGVQLGTKQCYAGDIDMQIDYQLIDWPASSSAYVGLQAVFADAVAERFSQPDGGEVYGSIIQPRFTTQLTSDTSGTLRVTRVAGVATTYYLQGGSWHAIDSAPAPKPAVLQFGLNMNPGVVVPAPIEVALDNFTATASGPTSCF
jgi:DNA-binding SARP family transcriptional activator